MEWEEERGIVCAVRRRMPGINNTGREHRLFRVSEQVVSCGPLRVTISLPQAVSHNCANNYVLVT